MSRKGSAGLRFLVMSLTILSGCGFSLGAAHPAKALNLIPTPQYVEPLGVEIILSGARPVRIVTGVKPHSKTTLAAQILKEDFERRDPRLKVSVGETAREGDTSIHLADLTQSSRLGITLNFLDQQVLSPRHFGQSYILRTGDDKTVWIVGGPQGLLYGAMTLLQLAKESFAGFTIPGTYIRDFAHFRYRAAADWLLNTEINRWSLDWGQGIAGYEALCKRKLDQCLKYKINMVWFDGFGWGLKQRFRGYSAMMQRLNTHARERGINLVFAGYGASYGIAYQKGPSYEEGAYLGEVFYNRESYPNGPIYSCMGFPVTDFRKDHDPSTLGSCRGNDELNRLKAKELQEFVRAVEPGALYIHHEDFGHYQGTESVWKLRCSRCRQRWPSDDLSAPDGGAGGFANGYSWLINAVNEVKNPNTSYEAARDCQIILVSPVYIADSPSSEDWSAGLRHWQNIGKLLPQEASNVTAGFREIFPQEFGAGKWIDSFNAAMSEAGSKLESFTLFWGGGDYVRNDYPFLATSIMDSLFVGSRGISNNSGDGYQGPRQLLNAEYSWNAFSSGFYKNPHLTHRDALNLWDALTYNDLAPEEIFGEAGFLLRACTRLFGVAAAIPMTKYYSEYGSLKPEKVVFQPPDRFRNSRRADYLPLTWDKIYAIPCYWHYLAVDQRTWGPQVTDPTYKRDMERLGLSPAELHRRLKRLWQLRLEMAEKGKEYLNQALKSSPTESSREDLQFLLNSTHATIPLARALIDFHEALGHRLQASHDSKVLQDLLTRALANTRESATLAGQFFPNEIDPVGAEVGVLKSHLKNLDARIQDSLKQP